MGRHAAPSTEASKTQTAKNQADQTTKRQRQVLDLLLARPLDSNKALADALGCTVKNVEFHMSNILRKTKTASRMELVMKMLYGK
jgi:DNA-binding NarL/FixJ family response regulator